MPSTPARVDFVAARRVAFIRTLAFLNYDFTAATFALQVRDRWDGGALRADLVTTVSASAEGVRLIYAGTTTITAHIAAGRLSEVPAGYVTGDNLLLSQVGVRINETTMEAWPYAPEIGDDRDFYFDLHITPSGGVKDVYARGIITATGWATE